MEFHDAEFHKNSISKLQIDVHKTQQMIKTI